MFDDVSQRPGHFLRGATFLLERLFGGKQQLQAIQQGDLKDGVEMFKALCQLKDLTPQAKGYVLSYFKKNLYIDYFTTLF